MSSFEKIPIETAEKIAQRFMKYIEPYVIKMSVAGSIRRRCWEVGDIEIVCVPKDEFSMGKAFPEGYPGLKVNGSKLKRFIYPDKKLRLNPKESPPVSTVG